MKSKIKIIFSKLTIFHILVPWREIWNYAWIEKINSLIIGLSQLLIETGIFSLPSSFKNSMTFIFPRSGCTITNTVIQALDNLLFFQNIGSFAPFCIPIIIKINYMYIQLRQSVCSLTILWVSGRRTQWRQKKKTLLTFLNTDKQK